MERFYHNFKGFWGCESQCKVHVEIIDGIYHFCFEDIGIGTSVTNASELLATQMVEKYDILLGICKFYETYNHDDGGFDEITYTWENGVARNPQWKPSDMKYIFEF